MASLFRIALFVLALIALRNQLGDIDMGDLRAALNSYGLRHISLSVGFAVASFLAMASFEVVGLRYLGTTTARKIPVTFAIATGMVANALSQSVGIAMLTGSMVRFRAYERFGLGKAEIIRLSSFVTITAIIGLLVTGMFAFLTSNGVLRINSLEIDLVPVGLVLALITLVYLVWLLANPGREYGAGNWSFQVPSRSIGGFQLGLSSLDWILAATVLFFLLPSSSGLGYFAFLPAFFIAQSIATLSHVPGGAGIFEALVVAQLAYSGHAKAAILASLLIYRLIYYVIPLAGALMATVAYSLRTSRVTVTALQPQLHGEAR